jgi:hypothetical protein
MGGGGIDEEERVLKASSNASGFSRADGVKAPLPRSGRYVRVLAVAGERIAELELRGGLGCCGDEPVGEAIF